MELYNLLSYKQYLREYRQCVPSVALCNDKESSNENNKENFVHKSSVGDATLYYSLKKKQSTLSHYDTHTSRLAIPSNVFQHSPSTVQ
jgi:hypothetical protein